MLDAIKKSPHSNIVMTHGTYTMCNSLDFFNKELPDVDKTVILTGSMLPLKGFTPSDAPYNLGFAVSSSLLLDPGFYIAMNSRIFLPGTVLKDVSAGRFSEI